MLEKTCTKENGAPEAKTVNKAKAGGTPLTMVKSATPKLVIKS
jgi:hypothetical protein